MRHFFSPLLFLFTLHCPILHGFELPWANQKHIQGNFIQEKHLAALSRPFVTQGKYHYSPETGLVWNTLKPVNNFLLINQDGVSEKQADGSFKMLTTDANFSAMLLPVFSGDPQKLTQYFKISENSKGLTLDPIAPKVSSVMQTLDLVITEQALQQIILHESNGNVTNIYLEANTHPKEKGQ
ncbi:outer membrane lipoprotein carrier protein LolA [Paraglaciecola marina]|uniref:outer membrane lipoprotein carrier protein LolA n=1 Tax=Paraglaciecola marina TaxID=2500157 RepID=UPI00105F438A|nr:outer membrane lipoprotein carrier protein LolA [Paraglaciecola marina]